MIKKIAEEYNKKLAEINLNLLNKIKDLDYDVIGVHKNILYYKSKNEFLQIHIYINVHRITRIEIYTLDSFGEYTVVLIDRELETEEIKAISSELYNKHLGGNK